MRQFFSFAIIFAFLAIPVAAANRLALVIGNDSYIHVTPLQKARGDATSISSTLEDVGFEVDTVLDATRRDMNRAVAQFTAKLQPGDTALVFYAGHGVEIDGENYLLPLDIEAPDATGEDFVKFESLALSDLMYRVQQTGARTTLMFIDACRDNPFATTTGRSIGGTRGLARITAPEGSFVVFSAGARQQALDRLDPQDDNENSVFTRLLLPKLTQPDLELRDMVSDLRLEVRDLALTREHAQFPAYYDELLGQFYFTSNRGLAPTVTVQPAPTTPATGETDIRADFALARSVGTAAAYELFLNTYRDVDDLAVKLAEAELAALGATSAPTPEPENVPAIPVNPSPAPAVAPTGRQFDDAKDRVRATQSALNARGCSAGGADGVAGARTHAAFAAFITHSGKALTADSLGSQHALDVINSTSGRVCPEATTARASTSAGTPQAAGASLAGTWYFSASCPFFIKATGSVQIRKTGVNSYAIATADSLGQTSQGTMREVDGVLHSNQSWSTGAQTTETSRLSADRRSYTGRSNVGCKFTARKTG